MTHSITIISIMKLGTIAPQHDNSHYNVVQHYGTRHNNILTLDIVTISIMTLVIRDFRIMTFNVIT